MLRDTPTGEIEAALAGLPIPYVPMTAFDFPANAPEIYASKLPFGNFTGDKSERRLAKRKATAIGATWFSAHGNTPKDDDAKDG